MTTYAGIDYGLGKTNIDKATGIRFGVIGQNAEHLNHDATQDIWDQGRNLSFGAYQDEMKNKLRATLDDMGISDCKFGDMKASNLDIAVEDAFEAIEQQLSDMYQGDNDCYLYEKDGYQIQTGESDLTVLKSPYYTHAQFCSPCFPGGGHLENPCADGPKTYCLGHDWFEDGKAPYEVYEVANPGFRVDPA